MQFQEVSDAVRENRLDRSTDDHLKAMLVTSHTMLTNGLFGPVAQNAITRITAEQERRIHEKETQESIAEMKRLQSAVAKLEEPHWTLTPNFIISLIILIVAIAALVVAVMAWRSPREPKKNEPPASTTIIHPDASASTPATPVAAAVPITPISPDTQATSTVPVAPVASVLPPLVTPPQTNENPGQTN